MSALDPVAVIAAKRDGGRLPDETIRWLFDAYLAGQVAEEQMAALLMAIVWRGMEPAELAAWTGAMIDSGVRLDLSGIGRPTVDKHSTGGVGDKISLILVPLVAALGAAVPQLSGRGLGHTGGTLDKLESIPGWRADLPLSEVRASLAELGGVICAASADLAPADRRLYALRDVTATVESIPLIASSIMSKKIAEGTEALLLDVKVGSGAFMTELGAARRLAETMIALGEAHGVRTAALLTAMDTPLGEAAGNAVEVAESLEVLSGRGPADVRALVVAEAEVMLRLAGIDADPAAALDDGRALAKWRELIGRQGGDPDAPLPAGRELAVVTAPASGYVTRLDARAVGVAAWRLGAGRARPGDSVSATAGVLCVAKPGAEVEKGAPVLRLVGDDPSRVDAALDALRGAIGIGPELPPPAPLVIESLG
ncbi:thymidine phosphorylase [Acidiferrimicrobium sp. IK]|uniref:thymidine phosphorylase n=1 Tax=Acidiferrimicrobium sp. IK TaxID=2871700 RepID=UPI0021CB9103|nr:thymidine phosphorylase [Acidiferrimicrobium sp. IK]MCU4185838.1 thymidine phosphorylase [Acidiferrimicrobium sp. IK]